MAFKAIICYTMPMNITFTNSNENIELGLKQAFYKVVDFLYGTRARTNRTIMAVFASVIGAKLLESMAVVPYCGV